MNDLLLIMRRAPVGVAILLVAVLGLAVGCSDSDSGTDAEAPNEVTVYWATDAGGLVGEVRLTKTDDALFGALATLQSSAPPEGALPAFEPDARVLSSERAGSVALIDLNGAFAESFPPGGAQAQTEALAPLVYTASAVEGIDSVSITVDGQTPDIAGLSFDLSEPITTADLPIEVDPPIEPAQEGS